MSALIDSNIATGADLDYLAELWTESVRRKPGETDAAFRDRLRIEVDAQNEAAKRRYARITSGVFESAPTNVWRAVPEPEPRAVSLDCPTASCGTCPRCLRYKGER